MFRWPSTVSVTGGVRNVIARERGCGMERRRPWKWSKPSGGPEPGFPAAGATVTISLVLAMTGTAMGARVAINGRVSTERQKTATHVFTMPLPHQ